MRILIADDSSTKIGTILNVLREIDGFNACDAEYVLDLKDARRKLTDAFYDLLILDLNMPEELGGLSSMQAGADFVDEIMETRSIKKPTDIIILTAFDQSAQIFKSQIEHAGFVVLQYDPLSNDWMNILKSRVDYLILCQKQRKTIPKLPACDVAWLTAVPVETAAVLSLGLHWETLSIPDDPAIYHYATVTTPAKCIRIIHAQQSEMGMTAAATITSKIVMHFSPRYIIMTGIAAGLEKDCHLGDIMVGTDIWNYSSGKYEEIEKQSGDYEVILSPDPKHIPMASILYNRLSSNNYDNLLQTIKQEYDRKVPVANDLQIHFGPIACGVAVVASQAIVREQVKAHARKTIGLDMESYGVCYAAQTVNVWETPAIIVKAISDLGDTEKNDFAQPYAAYTSARFAMYLIEDVLF